MKLVRLEQYFDSNPYLKNKYVYKADDKLKVGDLVYSDGDKGYVGRIVEENVEPIYDMSVYKYTVSCNKEKALDKLKKNYLEHLISNNLREYEKMLDRGGYDDPNFGWIDCDMDDYWPDEDEMLKDPQYNRWAEEWANNVLKKWGVI